MSKKFLFIAVVLSSTVIFSANLYQGSLENGIKYFIYSDEEMATSSFNVYVNTGSNTEGMYGGSGISHYVEHLIAGGSTPYNDEKGYNDTLQSIGASMNAYTSNDVTCYFIASSEEFKETAVRTLSEWVLHCSFDSAQVAREKGVIEKEIIMYDTPSTNIYYDFAEEMYRDSPARYPVTGYLDVFMSISRDDILDYYKRRYVPENMTVVFAGNLDIKETRALIEKYFGVERRFFMREDVAMPDYSRAPFRVKRDYDVENRKVYIGYYLGKDTKEQRAAAAVLSYMLNGSSEMILERELMSKRKLAGAIDVYANNMAGFRSDFTVYIETDSNGDITAKSADSLIGLIAKSSKFKKDFSEAKARLSADNKFRVLSSFSAVGMIYDGYRSFSDPEYFLETASFLEKVTYEDVQELVKNYFGKPNILVAQKAEEESYPERKSFKIINFADETLKNGNITRFYDTQNTDYSVIYVSFPFGRKDGAKPASSSFVSGLLNEKIARSDFIKKSLSRGSAYITDDATIVGIKTLSKNADAAIDYLSGLFKSMSFDDEIFTLQKTKMLTRAKSMKEDPAEAAGDDFERLFVQNGNYTASPSEGEIEQVTMKDVEADVKNMLSGNQKVYAWGSFNREKVRNFALSLYREKKIFTRAMPGYRLFDRDSNNTQNDQSNIYIAYYTDEKFTEKELYALSVFSYFFRGSKSMIHEALRGENDLVYYGYGYLTVKENIPAFVLNAQTSEEKTDRAVQVMEEVFERVASGDFGDNEITQRKNEQLLKIRFEFTNPEWTLASDISDSYGPFKDRKYYLNEKIGQITKDEMLSAVKKLLKFKSKLVYR